MKKMLVATAMVCLACADADPADPEPRTIAGEWRHSLSLTEPSDAQSHIGIGTMVLAVSGDAVSGSGSQGGTCSAAAGDYVGPLADGTPFGVAGAVAVGGSVTLEAGLCRLTGSFLDDDTIGGTATCRYAVNDRELVWSGDWLAHRN